MIERSSVENNDDLPYLSFLYPCIWISACKSSCVKQDKLFQNLRNDNIPYPLIEKSKFLYGCELL